jgi:hypothetical protein
MQVNKVRPAACVRRRPAGHDYGVSLVQEAALKKQPIGGGDHLADIPRPFSQQWLNSPP